MICYPCTSYSFFVLFPLTIMTISDNKIKSNPHRYAKKAYFMKSYGGGTKNKSASPIFPISVYVVNLHTNHKNTKPTKPQITQQKLHITHQKFKIVPFIENPKKIKQKNTATTSKNAIQKSKISISQPTPTLQNPIKSTKITHLHSDTKITYKNATKKDLRISTKVFNSIPLQSQTKFYQIIAFYTSFL